MAQKPKYQVELPTGEKFEIEEPSTHGTADMATSIGTGVVKGAGDVTNVTPIVQAVQTLREVAPDIKANAKSGAQSLGQSFMEFGRGAIDSPMAQLIRRAVNPASEVGRAHDLPTQADIDPAMGTADPLEANARRATNVLGLVAGPRLIKAASGIKLGGPKGAPAPKLPTMSGAVEAELGGLTPKTTTGVKISGPIKPAPSMPTSMEATVGSKAPVPTGTAAIDNPMAAAPVKNVGGRVTGPQISMNVLRKPPVKAKAAQVAETPRVNVETPSTIPPPKPVEGAAPGAITHSPEMDALIAEAQARGGPAEGSTAMLKEVQQQAGLEGRTVPPGTEPAYQGTERSAPGRVPNPEMDRLMNETRTRMTEKLPTNPDAAISVPEGPQIAEPSLPLDKVEKALAANRPGKGGVVRIGYDKPKTKTLYRVEPKDFGDKGEWLKKSLTPEQYAKFVSERGRLFGDDLSKLENYGHGADTHNTFSVDVPEGDAAGWARQHPDGFTEYVVPEDVVGRKLPVQKGPAEPPGAPNSGRGGQLTPEGAAPPQGKPASPTPVLGGPRKTGPSPEVQARLDAGETLEDVAADLRDKHGSKVAVKMLGKTPDEVKALSGGGPSRIPANAIDAIKAKLAPKVEAGTATPQEQALWDRIKSERGAADLKHLLIGGGAVAGGMIGASLGDGDPLSDESLKKTALGILGGAALPAAVMHPHHILSARTEGFLSGMAIPKNILNNTMAPIVASLEGTSTKGRFAPAKELFNLPANTKNFVQAMKNPASTNKYGKIAGPFSRTIGAIDTTARKLMERGGVPSGEIDRHLLTADRNVFGGFKPSPRMKAILDVGYPFQRVPANVFAETADAIGRTTGASIGKKGVEFNLREKGALGNPDMRTALDLAATGGGVALGKWAQGDKKRMYLASIAMALMGPRAGLGTIGAMTQVGRQGMGGISPIPEQNADLASFIGWPPTGYKALKKIFGGEQ